MAPHIVLKAQIDTPKVSWLLWVKVMLPLPSYLSTGDYGPEQEEHNRACSSAYFPPWCVNLKQNQGWAT